MYAIRSYYALDDETINGLLVTEVICSKGRSDAKVYLDKSYLNEKEQNEALRKLRTVSGYIQNHCKQSEGWYKAPKLTFEFDEQFEKQQRIEELFAKISKKKGDDNE